MQATARGKDGWQWTTARMLERGSPALLPDGNNAITDGNNASGCVVELFMRESWPRRSRRKSGQRGKIRE